MMFVWQLQLDHSALDAETCGEYCASCAVDALRAHFREYPDEQGRVDFMSDEQWQTTGEDEQQAACECDECGLQIGKTTAEPGPALYRPNLLYRLQPHGGVDAGRWLPDEENEVCLTYCDNCAPACIEAAASEALEADASKLFSVFVLPVACVCSKCGDGAS